MSEITENVKKLLSELSAGNGCGEKITLVAATKTQTAQAINEAVAAGITDIGENRVQEFRDKFDLVCGGNRHFIGHLQTNKVKYLIGKTFLYHSCDRMELAEEISRRSQKAGVCSDVLVQINIGCEESKGGFDYRDGFSAYERIKALPAIRVRGFMAMLPVSDDEEALRDLVRRMRALYEQAARTDENIAYLSMGMSGDWRLCVQEGANMVRIGTAVFGKRNYDV